MFKKNEIFKYKSKNEPDYVYDQFICVTDNKKIILKTKHSKYTEFSALTDFIATSSTTLKEILAYLNSSFLNDVNIKCVLTLKDFEANLTEEGAKGKKQSLCLRAYEDGLITKFGSVFKISKLTDKKVLFENASGSPIFSIHEIKNCGAAAAAKKNINNNNNNKNSDNENSSNINNNNNDGSGNDKDKDKDGYLDLVDNEKFRIYQSESYFLESQMNKFIENYVNKNDYESEKDKSRFSSFIEVSSSTKFYSNDLLIKIEDGMNHITEKIIDSSKKISELTK